MENRIDQQSQARAGAAYRQYPDLEPSAGSGQARQYRTQLRQRPQAAGAGDARLGTGLGWLSVGLGMSLLFAPRALARATGLPAWPMLLRAIGARELASGIGLLTEPRSPVWRWSRVAGDAMDMTLLGAAAFSPGSQRRRLAATAAFVGGVTALDVRASAERKRKLSSEPLPGPQGGRLVKKSVAVNRPPEECYRFWRDFERFPSFMQHIESVQVLDERRSHWRARGPAGTSIEWDAEITEDQPGQLLAWRSVAGSEVDNAGSVRFTPAGGGKGTIVQVQMEYHPPAGKAGALIAMLFGEEPAQQVEQDLRRFKQLVETGEIPTTEGQPHGVRTLKARLFNLGVER
jgi:uncharacterized membrane protein